MSFDSTGVLMGAGIGVACVGAAFFVWRRSNGTAGGNAKQIKSKEGTNGGERKFPAGKLSIYFGSQTGTAEGFARVLMEEGRNHGFDAKMVDLDNFDAEELMNCKLAIFLMATYGEGEPTDNAARFAKWIDPAEKGSSTRLFGLLLPPPRALANFLLTLFHTYTHRRFCWLPKQHQLHSVWSGQQAVRAL